MPEREKMFFLDDTGVQIFSRSSYGRSPKGTRPTKNVRQLTSRNYSIATAINDESFFFFEIEDKAYNSEDYALFLNKLIEHLRLNNIEGAYLIIDNVRFYKTELIVNLIESREHHCSLSTALFTISESD